ncbi:Uncharacterised protein [Serratia proteamaculans]|uniref:Fimbrial adhesin MrpH C-terminal domain-containing protein n=1 Tax=Serratia proteamaculans TaxID=28151 RepID=A0ABS0TQF2_SERPR|nr:hypothetical protein [Serratia proteamaculans]KAB1493899.1 hypothetical protein F8R23_21780 [Serratia proteamaculans]MBI6180586.1 hypothetical protein [Serratia proteamaculans]CAI1078140.1 Uncharacterised protein [Serratia proteamaculans]CAI1103341.1 Uncharacterised protein [Serratia proteamaculans]CAI2515885.1 Uncharacterised protein [Serratia proteamaculans]
MKKWILLWLVGLWGISSTPALAFYLESEVTPGSGYNAYTLWIKDIDYNDPSPNPFLQCDPSIGSIDKCVLEIEYGDRWSHSQIKRMIDINHSGKTVKTMGGVWKYIVALTGGYLESPKHYSINMRVDCFRLLARVSYNRYVRVPGDVSQCRPPVVGPNVCSVQEANIALEHGMLAPGRVNGNIASGIFHVSCVTPLPITVISQDGVTNDIRLSPMSNFRSRIKVNDVDLAKGVEISATPAGTPVRITSELAGYDQTEMGHFQGSTVMVISFL